jgi:acetate kinase
MDTLVTLNAGSSSIRLGLFARAARVGMPPVVARAHAAVHLDHVELELEDAQGQRLELAEHGLPAEGFDPDHALDLLLNALGRHFDALSITAVGHRVVHGGLHFAAPVRVTAQVLNALEALVPLAPLHQPHNLAALRMAQRRWPDALQVACFDTAFHRSQPLVARSCALPRALTDAGIQRYGFHGLSYEYISGRLPQVLSRTAQGRVIVAHLGNGASLCALVAGHSIATTMGFSVLDGLMMGSRCGTLDPGVVLYLIQHLGMSADAVSELLYQRSGLLGVSGISGDMETLLATDAQEAREALDLFVYRTACAIGSLTAALGGLDALVFTAGIGEHAAGIRARICAACGWLGASIDASANAVDLELIHAPDSRLDIAVIATDEESMIARHVADLMPRGITAAGPPEPGSTSERVAPSDQVHQHDHYRNDQEDMDETAHGIGRNHAE